MRIAVYARVSTARQAQAQTIEQQLDRLRAAVAGRGWELDDQHVYRDDGYSGASLGRPGLDRLRDHAALAELDVVVVAAPDRLARNYVHQVLLIDELAGRGCQVEFLDRPMSSDPHDQLLLQIRGAVAEYERYAELGIALVMPTARLCRLGGEMPASSALVRFRSGRTRRDLPQITAQSQAVTFWPRAATITKVSSTLPGRHKMTNPLGFASFPPEARR